MSSAGQVLIKNFDLKPSVTQLNETVVTASRNNQKIDHRSIVFTSEEMKRAQMARDLLKNISGVVKKDDKKAVMDIKAMDYEGYHYIVTEEFNHKKREVKDLKVTLYNPQGYVVKEEQVNKDSRKVEPGTPAYAVFQLIWGGK